MFGGRVLRREGSRNFFVLPTELRLRNYRVRTLLGLVRQPKDRKDRTSRKQPIQWLKEVKEIPRSVVKESPGCQLCGHPDQEPGWTSGGRRGNASRGKTDVLTAGNVRRLTSWGDS